MRVSDRSTAVADDRPGRSHLAPAVSEDDQAARAEALEEEVHELAYFAPPRPEPSADPEGEDPDPVSFELESLETDENRSLETRVKHVVGVKFSATGRIVLHDSGDEDYRAGEPVVVAVERGTRRGVVAIASHRRVHNGKKLARVLRRPNDKDQRAARAAADQTSELLQSARAHARTLGMPVKVFRAEASRSGKKVVVYFTAEGRVDGRALMKRLSQQFNLRVELRQTGVRDGAKAVGGIGSCGLELCCTTWLPEFVPVSIKMAKDQGLVLNPTKVSGQCGRLKCCLVYEQETYAALRKGLPKLGKRVITAAGEGRVVEVDVLRQRVRVSLGPGESEVFPGHEVKPMFPSQPQKPRT